MADIDAAAVELALARRRLGRTGRWPGAPTLVPLLLLAPVFSAPALLILQPVFTDRGVAVDFLGGSTDQAMLQLSAISSAFFAAWGPGTLLLSTLSDYVGRKPVLLGCAAGTCILSFACSIAPSFRVYAVCRALLGVTCGAQGAVSFLHTLEWAIPRDHGLLTCVLMSTWSIFGILLAWIASAFPSADATSWRQLQLVLCLASAVVIPLVALTLESPASLASRSHHAAARHTLSVALTHRFPTSLGRCHASMAIITPLAARRAPPQHQSASGGAGAGWDTAGGRGDAERGRCGGWDTAGGGGSELPLSAPGGGAQGGPMEAVRLRTADSAAAEAVRREIASQGDYSHHGPHANGERGAGVLIPLGGGDDAGGASSSRGSRSSGRSHPPTAESFAPKVSSAASARHSTASSAEGAQGCWGVCRAWGGPLTVTGLCWLAVALLYYGLDFAANGCEAANGCDKYSHLALYCLFDVPGYILGYFLADLPAIGRKRALGISLALAGGCLMLTPPLQALAPGSGAEIALGLSLAGKLGASSGFVLAYMLPAEIFPIRMRGLAIGVANIFARCGSILAPLCGSAPPLVVQTGLGSMALTICALAMVALPDLRPSATRAD